MYYLYLSLLALVAILINYKIELSLVCLTFFIILLIKNKNINARKIIIMIVVFLAFFVRSAYINKTNSSNLENGEYKVTVNICDKVAINGDSLTTYGYINDEKVLIAYKLKSEEEKIFYKDNFSGGSIVAKVNVEDINEAKNFYSFDYKNYMKNNFIYKRVKIENIYEIGEHNSFYYKFKSTRIALMENIAKDIRFNKSGYFQSLVFGDKSYMLEDDKDTYKNLGTSHLLAISGLHIATLISIIYFLLSKFQVSQWLRDGIIFLFLPLYVILVGAGASSLRATITIMLYLLFRKRLDKFSSYSLTLLMLLFYNPLYIFDVGFQLSFFITFCLMMSSDYINDSKNKLVVLFKLSLISSIASFPIVVANFYSYSYIGVISNIVLVPIFSLIVFPTILISYSSYLISAKLFNVIFKPLLNLIFFYYDGIQNIFSKVSILRLGKLNDYILIVIFILTLALLVVINNKKYKTIPAIIVAIILLISINNLFLKSDRAEKLTISGQTVYYISSNRKNILINTSNNIGNFYNDFRKKDKEYDIIKEYNSLFDYEGISKFDCLILTNSKKKSTGYAENLVGSNRVTRLVILEEHKDKFKDLIGIANFNKIDVVILQENSKMTIGSIEIVNDKDKLVIEDEHNKYEIGVE